MQKFDDDSIQNALDKITASNIGNETFICVEFIADDPKILVRYCDEASISSELPSAIQILTIDKTKSIQVSVFAITGPKIIAHLGDLRIHPPYVEISAELAGEMGGDQCRNANSMDYYGTIAFYLRSAEFQMSGRCNGRCVTTNALVSNNHVIARNDAGKPGEVIWTPLRNDTARLQCVIPLTCYSNVDIAFAQVNDMTGIPTATIRIIGKISGFRRPNIGEAIRKYGARSGYKTGSVTGKANIQVDGIMYRGVFSTTGDSAALEILARPLFPATTMLLECTLGVTPSHVKIIPMAIFIHLLILDFQLNRRITQNVYLILMKSWHQLKANLAFERDSPRSGRAPQFYVRTPNEVSRSLHFWQRPGLRTRIPNIECFREPRSLNAFA